MGGHTPRINWLQSVYLQPQHIVVYRVNIVFNWGVKKLTCGVAQRVFLTNKGKNTHRAIQLQLDCGLLKEHLSVVSIGLSAHCKKMLISFEAIRWSSSISKRAVQLAHTHRSLLYLLYLQYFSKNPGTIVWTRNHLKYSARGCLLRAFFSRGL